MDSTYTTAALVAEVVVFEVFANCLIETWLLVVAEDIKDLLMVAAATKYYCYP
jgi:hypothetical protein